MIIGKVKGDKDRIIGKEYKKRLGIERRVV